MFLVSDFLLEIEPDLALSYQLRRYGTWYGIIDSPPIKTENTTILQAVSEDTRSGLNEYTKLSHVDCEYIKRLERTISYHPFWIEGQFLAYKCAEINGRNDVSSAIKLATIKFIERIPNIEKLTFSDGTLFINEEVSNWLKKYDNMLLTQNTVSDQTISKSNNELKDIFKLLSSEFSKSEAKRDEVLSEIKLLKILKESGLTFHVSNQAQRLLNEVNNLSITEWEPSIITMLNQLLVTSK